MLDRVKSLQFGKVEEERKLITLGYDLKITPEGRVYIIEINGANSGLKGLERLTNEDIDAQRSAIRRNLAIALGKEREDKIFGKKWKDLHHLPGPISLVSTDMVGEEGVDLQKRLEEWNSMDNAEREQKNLFVWEFLVFWFKKGFLKSSHLRHCYERYKKSGSVVKLHEEALGISCFLQDKKLGWMFFGEPGRQLSEHQLAALKNFLTVFYASQAATPEGNILIAPDDMVENNSLWVHPNHYVISERDILQINFEEPVLRALKHLPTNNNKLEALCDNKMKQKAYIPDRNRAPFQYLGEGVDWRRWKRQLPVRRGDSRSDLVVLKKIQGGRRGEEVRVLDLGSPQTQEVLDAAWNGYGPNGAMVEDFVPSKKIYSNETGDYHDGCMRFLVDLEAVKRKEKISFKTVYEGVYWRLAPRGVNGRMGGVEPQGEDQFNLRYRANLAKGALPELVKSDDLNLARKVVLDSVSLILSDTTLF